MTEPMSPRPAGAADVRTILAIRVPGIPVPQGSMRGFVRGGKVALTGDNPALRSWRRDVTDAFLAAGKITTAGPLWVVLEFAVLRPRGHFGTGRNALNVRPTAPGWPATRPDIDKLARAILDAGTVAGIWLDDGQVVVLEARKIFATSGHPPGVFIRVEAL